MVEDDAGEGGGRARGLGAGLLVVESALGDLADRVVGRQPRHLEHEQRVFRRRLPPRPRRCAMRGSTCRDSVNQLEVSWCSDARLKPGLRAGSGAAPPG